MINKKTLRKKTILIFSIIISGLILFCSDDKNVIVHLLSLLFLVVSACTLQKFDIFHPYVWYSFFYMLYSSAYPILYLIGYKTSYGYSKELMFCQWLGLSVILLILPSKTIDSNLKNRVVLKVSSFFKFIENTLLLYILLLSIYFIKGSYSNKNDIYAHSNFLITIGFSLCYLAILMYCYELYILLEKNSDKYKITIFKFGFIVVLFSFVTGERDYLFTFILVSTLILFYMKKINIGKLLLLVPVMSLLLPLTNIFKYYILSGNISGSFSWNNIIVELLDGEFISASRNLQILLSNNTNSIFQGKSLLNDFIRIFFSTGFSNQTWFNDTFFSYSHSTKYGFTLIGEGYVNFGLIGIVIICCIFGFIIRITYLNSSKNIYFMIMYLYMIPLFIYSTRADIANVISPFIKYAFFGSLIIYGLNKIKIKLGVKV